MGKGDKKTKRGKITIGSYGVKRRHKTKQTSVNKEKARETRVKAAEEVKAVVEPIALTEEITEKKPVRKAVAKKAPEKAIEGEAKPKAVKPKKKTEPKPKESAEEEKTAEIKTEEPEPGT